MHLASLTATALAAAIIAAAAVLAFSQLPALFVWAAFIGWASYDHSGATPQAALRSSAALVFGVIMAWLVAIGVTAGILPINTSMATAVIAGLASFLIVAASRTSSLSVVPATFYGFASTFACLSLSPGAFTVEALTAPSVRNVILTLPVSLVIGTGLGMLHGWLANFLTTDDGKEVNKSVRLDRSHSF
jgi:Protein of unknown function (DUF1097)